MALHFQYKNEINCLENYHSASAFHLDHTQVRKTKRFHPYNKKKSTSERDTMRAFVGVMFYVCCGSLIAASELNSNTQSEGVKQEKRSLSHGALGGGYPSYSGYPSYGGSYGSYGLAGSYGSGGIIQGGGYIGSGAGIYGGGLGEGSIVSSGPVSFGGAGIPASGPGFVSGGSSVTGVSTNTNTLTTVRQNVPVPVPV